MQLAIFRFGGRLIANIIVMLALCFSSFGCAKCPKTGADFVGSYEMIRPEGKVSMKVLADGTFSERFEPSAGGELSVREGTWEFHIDKGEIRFRDYMSINTRFSKGDLAKRIKEKLEAWFLYHCKWGKIDIYLDEDQELFHKI
jgi:hypothetical protein